MAPTRLKSEPTTSWSSMTSEIGSFPSKREASNKLWNTAVKLLELEEPLVQSIIYFRVKFSRSGGDCRLFPLLKRLQRIELITARYLLFESIDRKCGGERLSALTKAEFIHELLLC